MYEILDEGSVATYVSRRPALAAHLDPGSLDVREVGDGNLNLVFVCRDGFGRSLVLKQALPYVRVAGPSWPLTADRSHAEARGLRAAEHASPATATRLLEYDPERHVLALEDLSHLTVLRTALNEGRSAPGAIAACGRHVARLIAGTGFLTLSASMRRAAAERAANEPLCRITDALVFREPFVDHPNNRFAAALAEPVRSMRADTTVQREVARLAACFAGRPEALVHGDLHTGSVMVGQDGDGSTITKVIDPEFCFYGPVAFDLGTLLANVSFAAARAHALGRTAQLTWLGDLPAELWNAFTDEFWTQWANRSVRTFRAPHADAWLEQVGRDALGFAGCEVVRRVVGFAKVTDIESLPEAHQVIAASSALDAAHRWLSAPHASLGSALGQGFAAPSTG